MLDKAPVASYNEPVGAALRTTAPEMCIRDRGVDGVVIACVNFYDPQVVELVNGDVPVVTIDHVFNNRMAILSDNRCV